MIPLRLPLPAIAHRLREDRGGMALLEFAVGLPIVLAIALYGLDTANLAIMNMRVSQVALNLADNASRVGDSSSANTVQLRELDINDVLTAARKQSESWELTKRGRIILSSLEEHDGKQMIHWQRCLGMKSGGEYDSHYGTTKPTDGTDDSDAYAGTVVSGMGPPTQQVKAPPQSGVMFVEINYNYNPLLKMGGMFSGKESVIRYTASFIVRDNREFAQIYNPGNADRYTCNGYSET